MKRKPLFWFISLWILLFLSGLFYGYLTSPVYDEPHHIQQCVAGQTWLLKRTNGDELLVFPANRQVFLYQVSKASIETFLIPPDKRGDNEGMDAEELKSVLSASGVFPASEKISLEHWDKGSGILHAAAKLTAGLAGFGLGYQIGYNRHFYPDTKPVLNLLYTPEFWKGIYSGSR